MYVCELLLMFGGADELLLMFGGAAPSTPIANPRPDFDVSHMLWIVEAKLFIQEFYLTPKKKRRNRTERRRRRQQDKTGNPEDPHVVQSASKSAAAREAS